MTIHHNRALDTATPAIGSTRLTRRSVLHRSAMGLAVPAALTLSGLTTARAGAQATPAATPPGPSASGYAPVNGLEMYYETHGTGQPLVLLHGGFSNINADFGRMLPELAKTRQVIAVEFQAHGRTADIDRPLRFEHLADDVAALTTHLGIDLADLLGFSLGGGVALQTAIRHPELVRKLVVVSAVYKNDGWHPEILAAMRAMTPMHEAYVSIAPKPEDWPALVTKMRELLTEVEYDWTTDIAAIAAPTLLVVGDSDNVRPAHMLELFGLLGGDVVGDLAGVPSSQFTVLPSTSHFGMMMLADLLPLATTFLDAPMS